jgi:hypothetical protein
MDSKPDFKKINDAYTATFLDNSRLAYKVWLEYWSGLSSLMEHYNTIMAKASNEFFTTYHGDENVRQ